MVKLPFYSEIVISNAKQYLIGYIGRICRDVLSKDTNVSSVINEFFIEIQFKDFKLLIPNNLDNEWIFFDEGNGRRVLFDMSIEELGNISDEIEKKVRSKYE